MNGNRSPLFEKTKQLFSFSSVQGCKPWKRLSSRAIKGWRDAPDASVAIRALLELIKLVFFDSVRWISNDSMDRILGNSPHPFETVSMENQRLAYGLVGVVKSESLESWHVDVIEHIECNAERSRMKLMCSSLGTSMQVERQCIWRTLRQAS